jgi:transposase
MASRRDALRSLLRGARSVSLAGTHHPAAASYATTSGWYERNARGGTRALDRASREERALNDLLVQSGHHERVLALVQNGVVSHDVSPGVPDATPASADQASSISGTAEKPRKRQALAFRAANVATAFSRLRSALRRVPLGGPVNRRREVAAHVVRHDARYAKMREMLRDALPRFGPIELATTVKALADIHAFAGHGRAPALRASHHDTPEKHDTELGVLFARCMKTHARECDTRRTVLLVAGVRGLGRVAHRIADDDGWRAVSDAVSRAAVSAEDPSSRRTRSDTRGLFACLAWNLHYGDSWRSANRLKRAREPLARARAFMADGVWRAMAEKIVFGARLKKSSSSSQKKRSDSEEDEDVAGRDDTGHDTAALPLSRRGFAMAMDAFCVSAPLRAALEALDAETGGAARRELQAAADAVAAATFGETGFAWRYDPRVDEIRRRLLIGWGPTPARVAAGRAPTECAAIARGCDALGLRAHEGFAEPAPAWVSSFRNENAPRRRRRSEDEASFFARDDLWEEPHPQDASFGLEDDDRRDDNLDEGLVLPRSVAAERPKSFLDVESFRVAGGRLDLAAIPPAPPKP